MQVGRLVAHESTTGRPLVEQERLAGGSTTIGSEHLSHEVLRLLVAAEPLHELREREVRLRELGRELQRLPEERLRRHEVATLVRGTGQLVLAVGIVPALSKLPNPTIVRPGLDASTVSE